MSHITESQFTDRFVSLVLGSRELPKKQLDRHILFISSILKLEPGRRKIAPTPARAITAANGLEA